MFSEKIVMNNSKNYKLSDVMKSNYYSSVRIWSTGIFQMVFVLMILVTSASAQNKEFTRNYFPNDSRGLRDARKNLVQGEKLYEQGWGNFDKALEFFLKAQQFNPDNGLLNLRIGECYLYTPYKERSVKFLERAVELNVEDKEVFYLLGVAYQQSYKFDQAVEQFNHYRQLLSPQEAIQERTRIERRLAECENALKMIKSPVRVFIDNLGDRINTEFDDYSPVLSPDGGTVYFTSRRPLGKKPKLDRIDHKYFENVYFSRFSGNQWMAAQALPGKVNTKTHEATAGLSPDGRTLFIYRGDKGGDLFESKMDDNSWSKARRLPRGLTTKGNQETSIVFSTDGRRAYFISDRPGGFGNKDIWTSNRDERGRWSEPTNMGGVLNTPFDEESLFLAPDNITLYFSSQGHNSMGGFDIFKTEFRNGRWTQPQNIGHPINTPGDDLFFVMAPDGITAYYSSMKSDGLGGSDIYGVTFLGPEKLQDFPIKHELIASIARPLNHNLMDQVVEVVTVPMTILRGRVLDDKSNSPLLSILELYDNETEQLLAQFNSHPETGAFLISLPGGKNYGIAVKAEDYLFHSENINISEATVSREIINDIKLKKVEVGETIVLNNIFFDTGAATLRPESYVELGVLFRLMTENPSLKIQISGHTDNVGSASINKRLSEQRAGAVVNFLIGRGISNDRLTFKGFGFEKPIASNETAEGRQMNRRTEFEITEK
jgi:outer membrane protein OmpA-like peptidoglycan-associated protein/tetratricopeptide (TPR) repeat protein